MLEAAAGSTTKDVASKLQTRAATVSKWRTRFAKHGLSGLADAPRPGKPRVYDEGTERRILAQLDEPAPDGHTTWTGQLELAAPTARSALSLRSRRLCSCSSHTPNKQTVVDLQVHRSR